MVAGVQHRFAFAIKLCAVGTHLDYLTIRERMLLKVRMVAANNLRCPFLDRFAIVADRFLNIVRASQVPMLIGKWIAATTHRATNKRLTRLFTPTV
jgi:hypothetical protein